MPRRKSLVVDLYSSIDAALLQFVLKNLRP